MATITKEDRGLLYGRATQLSSAACEIDIWADQMVQRGLGTLASGQREIARLMRIEAEACRKWADGGVD